MPSLKDDAAVRNEKCLVRFQVLELIVRIAHQRYVYTQQVDNITDAVSLVFEGLNTLGGAEATMAEVDAFFDAFHTYDVDDVYKANQALLRRIYDRFSGLR